MKSSKFWLRILGVAVLLHIALIIVSVLEVMVYSYVIAPGKDQAFYEAHAQKSGPWISAIFGALFVFVLVRDYLRRRKERGFTYTLALPIVYIILDVLILLPFGIDWAGHLPVFALANGSKLAAALLAYYIYKPKADAGISSDDISRVQDQLP